MNHAPIQTATLTWNEQGTPVSKQFDDVYFSNQDGLEETRYVFLHGNRLPQRFATHPRPLLVVAETGFGTGLNFLRCGRPSRASARPSRMLHCNACTLSALKNSPAAGRSGGGACALAGAGPYADELRAQWPLPLPGCHRLLLAEGRITLDLWFGDVNELLPQFDASMNNQVDAWFLDGFAPAKIPTCGPSNCSPPWRVSPGRKAASPPLPPPASCAAACNRPGFRSTVAKASAKT